jgi:hypothetical protein
MNDHERRRRRGEEEVKGHKATPPTRITGLQVTEYRGSTNRVTWGVVNMDERVHFLFMTFKIVTFNSLLCRSYTEESFLPWYSATPIIFEPCGLRSTPRITSVEGHHPPSIATFQFLGLITQTTVVSQSKKPAPAG